VDAASLVPPVGSLMGSSSRERAVDASTAATTDDMAASDGGPLDEGVSLPEASALPAAAPLVAVAGSSTVAVAAGAAVYSARPMTFPGPAGLYEADVAVRSTGSIERGDAEQEGNTAAEGTQSIFKVFLPPRKPQLPDMVVGDVLCVGDVPRAGSAHLAEDSGAAPAYNTASVLAQRAATQELPVSDQAYVESVFGAEIEHAVGRHNEHEAPLAEEAAANALPDSDEAAAYVRSVVGGEIARALGPHIEHEQPRSHEKAANTPPHSDQAAAYGERVGGTEFVPASGLNSQHDPPPAAHEAAANRRPDSDEAEAYVQAVVGAEIARALGPHNEHEPPPLQEAAVNAWLPLDQTAAYGELVIGAEFAPALESSSPHRLPPAAREAATRTLPDSDEAAAHVQSVVGAEIAQALGHRNENEPSPEDEAAANALPDLDEAAAYGELIFGAEFAPTVEPEYEREPPPAEGTAAHELPPAEELNEVLCLCVDIFPETDDEDVEKDRWMTVRTFVAAMLAEPVLNIFGGCDLIDVEVLARSLIAREPSTEWIQLAPCVTPAVFVWQFLLLVRKYMDAQPDLCQAVGELLLFCVLAEEETMTRWEAKAKPAAKAYRDKWGSGDAAVYQEWLQSIGVRPAVTHVVSGSASKDRVVEQANELRTGQSWPGRPLLRAFPEDSTAERQRLKAADKREGKKDDKAKKKEVKAWEADDCRHDFPVSVLRAPGVVTFVCGCGYIIGFELLRETESPAHVVAALVQRFKKLPRVVYFDTACQAQRNALRRVPWLMDGACTAWFIDRFHRCNHTCSPVFNADQYPNLTRGHDTSGAERQHSIKKRSKNSLSYMTQRRFIVRSRYIAAHNNVRVSQRRDATKSAAAARPAGEPKTAIEIQHKPVETYYHSNIVKHCEMGEGCSCRDDVRIDGSVGLERKV